MELGVQRAQPAGGVCIGGDTRVHGRQQGFDSNADGVGLPLLELAQVDGAASIGSNELEAFAAAGVFDDGCHGANRSKRRCPGP